MIKARSETQNVTERYAATLCDARLNASQLPSEALNRIRLLLVSQDAPFAISEKAPVREGAGEEEDDDGDGNNDKADEHPLDRSSQTEGVDESLNHPQGRSMI